MSIYVSLFVNAQNLLVNKLEQLTFDGFVFKAVKIIDSRF